MFFFFKDSNTAGQTRVSLVEYRNVNGLGRTQVDNFPLAARRLLLYSGPWDRPLQVKVRRPNTDQN